MRTREITVNCRVPSGQSMRLTHSMPAAAIAKAGSDDPDAVAAAMRTMTDAKGITGPLMFTERGDRKDILIRLHLQ